MKGYRAIQHADPLTAPDDRMTPGGPRARAEPTPSVVHQPGCCPSRSFEPREVDPRRLLLPGERCARTSEIACGVCRDQSPCHFLCTPPRHLPEAHWALWMQVAPPGRSGGP